MGGARRSGLRKHRIKGGPGCCPRREGSSAQSSKQKLSPGRKSQHLLQAAASPPHRAPTTPTTPVPPQLAPPTTKAPAPRQEAPHLLQPPANRTPSTASPLSRTPGRKPCMICTLGSLPHLVPTQPPSAGRAPPAGSPASSAGTARPRRGAPRRAARGARRRPSGRRGRRWLRGGGVGEQVGWARVRRVRRWRGSRRRPSARTGRRRLRGEGGVRRG